MRIDEAECRRRLISARVAHLATVSDGGRPHIVPITFAITGATLVTAVDRKPKTTTNLRRLRNITRNPRVSVMADHYDDDWTHLWWVRVDGLAQVVTADTGPAMTALREKYPQYVTNPPDGPVVEIAIDALTGWSARD